MTALLAFIKLFWKPLVVILVALAILLALRHYGDIRYAKGVSDTQAEDAKVLAQQQIENAEKEKADAQRIANAYRDRDSAMADLAAIRARPAPRLVCHAAPSHREPVLEAARVPDAQAPDTRALPPGAGEGIDTAEFNPVPALIALADEADGLLADCRFLHQAVHGTPTR